MNRNTPVYAFVAVALVIGVYFSGLLEPTTSASALTEASVLAPESPEEKLRADQKIINTEQDIQADRCKNGYSEGCDKERAIADFKRATGQ